MSSETSVWDPLVRLFHWGLVAAFSISYISGEDESIIHIYTGYAVLGLISFRVIWGLIGTKHARFSDFVRDKRAVIEYLRSLISRKPKHYLGHNPAGGWMVIGLIISLFITTISGLQLYALEEGLGPLANQNLPELQLISTAYADEHRREFSDENNDGNSELWEEAWEEMWEEIHEVAANLTLLLIFIHIIGVIVSSWLHKENLVKAMINGRKKMP